MMHVASSLNSYGAELRTVARIGSRRELGVQLWQPMAPGSQWYVAPSLEYGANSINLFQDGRKIYRAGLRSASATLAGGRELWNWGDIQLGISRRFGRGNILVPEDPSVPTYRFYDTVQFANLRIDTLDTLAFPTRGRLLNAHWERSPSKDDGRPPLTQSAVIGLAAFEAGAWAGHLYGEWSRSNLGTAPQSLGGFLRLSGTEPDSLDGHTVAFGRIVMARKIGVMPTTIGNAIRLGFSAELGGGFSDGQSVSFHDLKQAGSIFLSADTRFGPLYFGAGATRGTGGTLYLFLGPVW
jgi:NTE family protein